MVRKFALAALVLTTFSGAANAVNITPPATATSAMPSAAPSAASKFDSMVPQAGESAKTASAKPDYDSMTRAEKLKMINDRHAASVKKAELKWKGTSDDDKIAKYEKRRNSFMARRNAKTQHTASAAAAANATAPAAGTTAAPAPAKQ